jgi:hypothetical protein
MLISNILGRIQVLAIVSGACANQNPKSWNVQSTYLQGIYRVELRRLSETLKKSSKFELRWMMIRDLLSDVDASFAEAPNLG